MDDTERLLQKDHAEKLKQERLLTQVLGVTRSRARNVLKEAIYARQLEAARAKAQAPLARPPAPEIKKSETRLDAKPLILEQKKEGPRPGAGGGAALATHSSLVVVDGLLYTADVAMTNLVEVP